MKGYYERYLNGETFDLVFQAESPVPQPTYIRRFQPASRLVILGGGHVAQSLCRFASPLGFEVTVADDRPTFANSQAFPLAKEIICNNFQSALKQIRITPQDYVAVVTRGHTHDADCMRVILSGDMPWYLGMIGSKRRVQGLFDMLEAEGYSRERMNQIHAPIGLPIGAITPDEIAISILAELIQCRSSLPKSGEAGLLEQTGADPALLQYLDTREEKAVAVVIGRKGSTPVKTGAIMALSSSGQIYGTVGGGCGEHEVIMAARRILQTGGSAVISVDMTNDIAEEEGMVCGGSMQVFIRKETGLDAPQA